MKNLLKISISVILFAFLFSGCRIEPDIVTLNIDDNSLTSYSAVIAGRILRDGTSPVTKCGFYWGDDRGMQELRLQNVATDFYANLSGLVPKKKYYYVAYAENPDAKIIGTKKEFITRKTPAWWTKTSQSYDCKAEPTNIVIVNSSNIWIKTSVNNSKYFPVDVYKSADGGVSWTKSRIPNSSGFQRLSISDIDEHSAWISQGTGLFRTVDGGSSWSLINTDFSTNNLIVHFFDANEGIIFVAYQISYVVDSNDHWSLVLAIRNRYQGCVKVIIKLIKGLLHIFVVTTVDWPEIRDSYYLLTDHYGSIVSRINYSLDSN